MPTPEWICCNFSTCKILGFTVPPACYTVIMNQTSWECLRRLRKIPFLCPWLRHDMETFSPLPILCVERIQRSTMDSPHNNSGLWGFMLVRWSCWTNNRVYSNLRRHGAQCSITVMLISLYIHLCIEYIPKNMNARHTLSYVFYG